MNKNKTISIFMILVLTTTTIGMAVENSKSGTNHIDIKSMIKVGNGSGSGSSSNSAIDLSKPPLYLFVSNPSIGIWCYTVDCDSEGDFLPYLTLKVRVTDIKFKNWKNVPVTVWVNTVKQTLKTDSNGDALFVFNKEYPQCNSQLNNCVYGIIVQAVSPISGREVYYRRDYLNDMSTEI